MTVEPIGVIALLVGMIGLFVEQSFIVYAFFASTLLGAAAALILGSLGGATIQPAHLLLGVLTVKLLGSRDVRAGALRAVAVGNPGFWLLVTVGYAAMTAYLLPRFFLGQTFAFSVRAQGENYAAPLAPSTSNLTQSVYFVGDCICFVVLSGFGSSEAGRKCLGRAALMCVILNLGFAVLDLATYATNTGELLSFIRNSTYSIMSDREMAGFKRVVGSFVEASSFGYWTLGYFAFATSLWLSGIAVRLTLILSVLSFFALLFSTSTTAYVGMSGYLFVEFVIVAINFLFWRVRREMLIFLICVPIGLAIVVVAICLNDASYAYTANLLDELVLNKMSTGSGIERSTWNNQAIQNFLDTFGFGVGNGSVRASSFPIAASLGFLGAATYALFLLTIWGASNRISATKSSQVRLFGMADCRDHVCRLYRSWITLFRICRNRMYGLAGVGVANAPFNFADQCFMSLGRPPSINPLTCIFSTVRPPRSISMQTSVALAYYTAVEGSYKC